MILFWNFRKFFVFLTLTTKLYLNSWLCRFHKSYLLLSLKVISFRRTMHFLIIMKCLLPEGEKIPIPSSHYTRKHVGVVFSTQLQSLVVWLHKSRENKVFCYNFITLKNPWFSVATITPYNLQRRWGEKQNRMWSRYIHAICSIKNSPPGILLFYTRKIYSLTSKD